MFSARTRARTDFAFAEFVLNRTSQRTQSYFSTYSIVFLNWDFAEKMQIARKATLFAALTAAVCPPVMLMDTVSAVEVSGNRTTNDTRSATAPSPDSFVLGSRTFTIPFTVDASGTQPVEVQLFVSRGQSEPWELIQAKSPTEVTPPQFEYTADQDGEFWFATRTTGQTGSPQLVSALAPQLKVYVDTTRPNAEVVAEADADGSVEVMLVIQDASPLKSLQLRYVTDTVRTWEEVDVTALPDNGRVSFKPENQWQQLSLQLIATDKAGNQSVANKLVHLPRIAEAPMHRYAALPGDGIDGRQTPYEASESDVRPDRFAGGPVIQLDRHRQSTDQGQTQKAMGNFRGAAFPSPQSRDGVAPVRSTPELIPPPEPQRLAPKAPTFDAPSLYANPTPSSKPATGALPPPASPEQISNGFGLTPPAQTDSTRNGSPELIPPPQGEADPDGKKKSPQPLPNRTLSEAMRPLSEQSALPPEHEEIPAPKPAPSPSRYQSDRQSAGGPASRSTRVPVRYADSLRFSLAYELEAVGSQGVEAIELYGSVDEGRTWKLWGRDPDRSSPFDIETREEGVFGYRIVVVGNNGLVSPRPQAGEAPDIVVVVDKQAPSVRITGAQYGEGDRIGALVVLFECSDANLTQRPIALSFSPNPTGPWTTIAAGLPNLGDYVWPADPQLPRQFYLRIDATDEAGNVGTYILDRPIDAQGLAPRARIRGFQSISGVPPESELK